MYLVERSHISHAFNIFSFRFEVRFKFNIFRTCGKGKEGMFGGSMYANILSCKSSVRNREETTKLYTARKLYAES